MLNCPLCESINLSELDIIEKGELVYLYNRLTKENFDYLIFNDIKLYGCINCKIKFYNPCITGDEKFYNALQKFDWYYLDDKEEYHYVKKFIKPTYKVLEIGSGKGAFAKFINCAQYVGLDFSEHAKNLAKLNGVIINNESIQNFSKKNLEKFDVVVSFQVLEHISEPKSFIEASLDTLRKNGLMIIALPSESSFLKFVTNGILNMPPHHVTRWSDETFEYLANAYNLKIIDIYHEKLQNIHKEWFLQTLFINILLKNKLVDLSTTRKIITKFTNLLAKYSLKYLKKEILPNGHTVVVVFKKQ